jgi:DNA end-binding protein Ku
MAAVKIIKGTEQIDSDVKTTLMHKGCGGAVRMPKTCEACAATLSAADVGKAVDGKPIDDEVLESFKVRSDKVIQIDSVVPLSEIDARLFEAPRYMVPDKGAETAVRAIRDGLARMKKPHAGIGKIAKEDHEVVVAVYVKDGSLVLHDLRWPEELRDAAPYAGTIDAGAVINEKLTKGVDTLLGDMVEHFNAGDYVDAKGQMRADVLRRIRDGAAVPHAQAVNAPAPVDDLVAQIEAAVKIAQAKKKVA